MTGLHVDRDRPGDADPVTVPAVVPGAARAAAAMCWMYAAGFGLPALPIAAYAIRERRLPWLGDLFPMYGGPWWGTLSPEAFAATLIGYAGVSLGTLIVLLASALPFVGLILLGSTLHMASLSAAAIIGWIVFAVVFIYISNVAGHVYKCALYLFASTGQTPAGYTPEMMNSAWSFKK